jgi:serine beta-lactamase-like protein LACTB
MLFACAALVTLPARADTPAQVIDAELARLFAPDAPGAAVLVVKDGVTVLNKGYGLANVELNVPMRADHLFYVASVGKQFTAAAILTLVEDGKLALDTPIRRFFPSIPPSWDAITVAQLLQHTSGIGNPFSDAGFRARAFEAQSPQQLLQQACAMPLLAPPGSAFAYSSANYTLLAMIVEQRSGASYEAYLARRFFIPLGMTHTHFARDDALVPGLVTPYEHGPRLAVRWSPTLLFGGGSFISNNADLLRWTTALQGGAVLKPASLRAMDTALVLPDGKTVPYGYGLRPHTLAGQLYLESNGDLQGFHAEVAYLPQSKVFVSLLGNGEDAPKYSLAPIVRRIALAAAQLPGHAVAPRPQAVPVSIDALRRREGLYGRGGEDYAFRVQDGRLQVSYPAQRGKWDTLLPVSPNEFYYEGESDYRIRFIDDADGRRHSQWFEIEAFDGDVDPVFDKR